MLVRLQFEVAMTLNSGWRVKSYIRLDRNFPERRGNNVVREWAVLRDDDSAATIQSGERDSPEHRKAFPRNSLGRTYSCRFLAKDKPA